MNQEIAEILDLLAERFGTTIEHLWEVMVRQAYAEAIAYLTIFIIIIFMSIVFLRYSKPMFVNENHESWDNDALSIFTFIGGLVLIASNIVFFFGLTKIIPKLLNPEYWALQQIIEVLK